MQSYKRKITYFYQYHNGNIGSTAGFLKLEIRGDKVKIIINIQEPPGLPFREAALYFYHEAGDHLAAIRVDKIESINGILTYQNRTDWQQIFDTGRDLYTFDGVAVVYNDSHYYIGDFKDKDRRDYALVRKEKRNEEMRQNIVIREESTEKPSKEEKTDEMKIKEEQKKEQAAEKMETAEELLPESDAADMKRMVDSLFGEQNFHEKDNTAQMEKQKDVFEKCENCPYHKKHLERQEQMDAFEKMIQEYPKLPMYGATELFDCVRIHPKDIGKLDMRNWKLGVNSFLTHGFYTYQYLLLGKMRFDDGSEHSIIGVPGVYSNREKYLANMFGFEQFIPVKKTGIKTGEFGYWIVEISPYLQ